ncbi:DUF1294 domain-containing protein [Cryobacterium psychrophilum]|nr:DUF1294 domain-containing protein [Cryobacterium psychrophilum]
MGSASSRHPGTAASPRSKRRRSGRAGYLVIAGFLVAYAVIGMSRPIPLWVAALYSLASIASYIVYAVDKSAARANRRRVPERSLLLLGLVCGWPGAIVAQQLLRHKTQKVSFRRAFWVSVVVNLAVFAALTTPMLAVIVDGAVAAGG